MKIEIKRWDNDNVIFSYSCENNTMRKTVIEAVRLRISLAYANLQSCHLYEIDFSGIDLSHADLSYSNCYYSDFINCNLIGTNLTGSNLNMASILLEQLIDVKGVNDQCPKTGSFIGWKKCYDGNEFIVKLEIPADAKRCSSTTNKCRCSKAKVLEIQNLDGTVANINIVYSLHNECFAYNIGEIVYPDWFDENFFNECSHGIHFFMNRDDAVNY